MPVVVVEFKADAENKRRMQAHAESDSSDDESAIGTELVVNNVPVEVFENRFVQVSF